MNLKWSPADVQEVCVFVLYIYLRISVFEHARNKCMIYVLVD